MSSPSTKGLNSVKANENDNLITKDLEGNVFYKYAIVIIILLFFFLFFLGINIFVVILNFLMYGTDIIIKTTGGFAYLTGDVINETSNSVSNISKTGVDITNGALHSFGDMIKISSAPLINNDLTSRIDNAIYKSINSSPATIDKPVSSFHEERKKESFTSFTPSDTNDIIQEQSSKQKWCLIGDMDGTRGCVSVNEDNKCMSGQIFPSKSKCVNGDV